MEFKIQSPSRVFTVGTNKKIQIKDCGSVFLEPDEQVTFKTLDGKEYDVGRKNWGFYATPSLNGRLANFNFRPVLVKNVTSERFYVWLVEKEKEKEFNYYLREESHVIVAWLDSDEALRALERKLEV